jgi:hypothetical protein
MGQISVGSNQAYAIQFGQLYKIGQVATYEQGQYQHVGATGVSREPLGQTFAR